MDHAEAEPRARPFLVGKTARRPVEDSAPCRSGSLTVQDMLPERRGIAPGIVGGEHDVPVDQ